MRNVFMALVVAVWLGGCASAVRYAPPLRAETPTLNFIEIAKPRAEVWKTAVPSLARRFFVINNLDQSSGLINVSYAGDPERYVDCGVLGITLMEGKPEQSFPAARAAHDFQFLTPVGLFNIRRRNTLDGRINLIFEEVGEATTRITATTRYVVDREMIAYRDNGTIAHQERQSITFNTGQVGMFPGKSMTADSLQCRPTGRLEFEVLDAIR